MPTDFAEILEAIRSTPLSAAERAALLRAIRETIPNLTLPNSSLQHEMRSAARISRRFCEFTANALAESALWQEVSATSPAEIRSHLQQAAELQSLVEEATAFQSVVDFGARHHHYLATRKARDAYRIAKELHRTGKHELTSHIRILKDELPKTWRRKRKA